MSLLTSFSNKFSVESGNEDNIYVSSEKEINCFDVRLVSILWAPKILDFSTFSYYYTQDTLLSLYYRCMHAHTHTHMTSHLLHYSFSSQGYHIWIFTHFLLILVYLVPPHFTTSFRKIIDYYTDPLYIMFCSEGRHQMEATGEL